FDKAMIGSCTNGSYDDLLQAAFVLRAARDAGMKKVEREFAIFPGSGGVGRQIEAGDPRLGGESIAEVFRSVGGKIRQSWCGPCFGQGHDALTKGQRAITSFNRNWQNRMGLGGEGYLASPAVVAASALAGYMAPPSELGLRWDAETFGVCSRVKRAPKGSVARRPSPPPRHGALAILLVCAGLIAANFFIYLQTRTHPF